MRRWGIKTRVLFLALAPAVVTAVVLSAYFVLVRIANFDEELRTRGVQHARQLAIASTGSVLARDTSALYQLAQAMLDDPDLAKATITDRSGAVLASVGGADEATSDRSRERTFLSGWVSRQPLMFQQSIDAGAIAVAENVDATIGVDAPQPTAAIGQPIGKVTIEMSRLAILERQAHELSFVILLGLLCLAGATVLALRMGREVTAPVGNLARAIEELGRGNFDVRVSAGSGGEFATLEKGVNEMAAKLKESQQNLQRRVSEATQSLIEQKDEAERANLAKSRFLAAASHDLRQPMHALILFVTALKDRIQYPEVSRIVQNIEASVTAMLGLFNALLDISRLDAGVLHANPVDFSIKTLLDRLRLEFTPHALEKKIKFHVVDSTMVVRTDPLLLERIVMNLVSNAVRYTAFGGVVVGCRRVGGGVRMEVWDTGPGIPNDRQKEIFQEFYQLGNPERDRSKGLGLGLAIVERMSKLLGSPVSVRSVVGRGSVFYFNLSRGVAERVAEERVEKPAFGVNPLAGKLIAVIDDEAPILEGMRGLVQNWECDVVTGGSGIEVMAQLADRGRAPDVVISDYRLREGETGIEVIRNIRLRYGATIPSVLVTGDTAPDRLREAESSGFHLVHKPIRPARLRALVTHLVQRSRTAAKAA